MTIAEKTVKNYLPVQYAQTGKLNINHNYLNQQFTDYQLIFDKFKEIVEHGDYTLGQSVDEFESAFSREVEDLHAIGVGSGTDALFLALKALNVGPGDEVITTPFTFYATIGAIVTSGAKPVFVDILPDFNLDPSLIAEKITPETKAIMPVHWAGKPCHMDEILAVAKQYDLYVVEDACHAIQAEYKNKRAGAIGTIGCFSFHPLKNLNVWGDGGMIVTQSDIFAEKLRLMRNHGLKSRDECVVFSFNSRLDTLQAVVGMHLLKKLENITSARIKNAMHYDDCLKGLSDVHIPVRENNIKQVYHLYSIQCEARDELQKFLIKNGIDAKVHYPIPMHLQPAAKNLGYKKNDFPVCEKLAEKTLSLPVHEFIKREDINFVANKIREFYGN